MDQQLGYLRWYVFAVYVQFVDALRLELVEPLRLCDLVELVTEHLLFLLALEANLLLYAIRVVANKTAK